MIPAPAQSPELKSTQPNQQQHKKATNNLWYSPTFSPEHGAYVVLMVSFLTGAAAAQQWNWVTALALICAFCGFQAEHPLMLQIKQRRSWKPQFLVWAGVYGGIAIAIAIWLFERNQENWPLLTIYGAALTATLIDGAMVWQRQQKSILNELVTFAALCLSAPLACGVTTGALSWPVVGLWMLNTLFFSSAIFTVKLRKVRTESVVPGLVFHALATGIVALMWQVHWLSPVTAAAFGVAILKFGLNYMAKRLVLPHQNSVCSNVGNECKPAVFVDCGAFTAAALPIAFATLLAILSSEL